MRSLRRSSAAISEKILSIVGVLALVIGLIGCATPSSDSAAGYARVPKDDGQPRPYMRVGRPDTNTVALEIAVRKFIPNGRKGPAIWLAAVSHIGEPDYYRSLQEHLDARTLVLYEAVGDGPQQMQSTGRGSDAEAEPASLQANLARSLGLIFQFDGIDYQRAHFRNSDLSLEEIQRLMLAEAKPLSRDTETRSSKEFQKLLALMDGSSALAPLLQLGLNWIRNSPQLQTVIRMVMIETLGQLQGDLTQSPALPPEIKHLLDVILNERNKAVVGDLKTELADRRPGDSISVFYGAGHMEDLEKRIRGELNYRPVGELWLTAFSANTRETGLSDAQIDWLRAVVQAQMKQLQP